MTIKDDDSKNISLGDIFKACAEMEVVREKWTPILYKTIVTSLLKGLPKLGEYTMLNADVSETFRDLYREYSRVISDIVTSRVIRIKVLKEVF